MVNHLLARGAWLGLVGLAAGAGCGSFEDPDVVIDLRVLAMAATPPDQVIDVDLTQPPSPAALLSQLVPTRVCMLVADPGLERRLAWSVTMCPLTADDRCDEARPEELIDSGVLDDPDTTVPEPTLCVTIDPDVRLLGVLLDALQEDTLRGLGGVDYAVQLRIGGEDGDRNLDQYATKIVRVAPRIPANRNANTNPQIFNVDARFGTRGEIPLRLDRCADNPTPLEIPAGTRLQLSPLEPGGVREVYVVPTLDGRSQTFTESLTYQWVASAGGFSNGSTGGPRDPFGNPAPLATELVAPDGNELSGPTDISLWIIQRDERLGVHWYQSCVRVAP
jgi:hypothetical protein